MQEEEEALKTVECLRGRLLAERAASKAAEHTAALMTAKLKELEEKLKIEEKCRRKAEKKLSILKKKFESLNIIGLCVSGEFDEFISNSADQISEIRSCVSISSSTASSPSPGSSDNSDLNIQPKSSNCSTSCSLASEDRNVDQGEKIKLELGKEKDCHHQAVNSSGLKTEKEEVDNSMALVPLNLTTEWENKPLKQEMKVDSEKVSEVLHTLKQMKQTLKTTMETRRIIQVG